MWSQLRFTYGFVTFFTCDKSEMRLTLLQKYLTKNDFLASQRSLCKGYSIGSSLLEMEMRGKINTKSRCIIAKVTQLSDKEVL